MLSQMWQQKKPRTLLFQARSIGLTAAVTRSGCKQTGVLALLWLPCLPKAPFRENG